MAVQHPVRRLTWDEACAWIHEGTVESLGRLRRSKEQLDVYGAFMTQMKAEYASVGDFIKISVMNHPVMIAADGKKAAGEAPYSPDSQQLVWRLNDFPYFFEESMQHWLLWSNLPRSEPAILQHVQEKFPDKDTIHFVNPAVLQTVPAVWHCHVLVRPKGGAGS